MNEGQRSTKDTQPQTANFILVVDDDHHLRQTIRWVLEEEGFSVQSAADGQEAVERVQQQQPSLIILDMGLPLLDGSEVAMQVQKQYATKTPIVLITADGHAEDKSRQIGAVSYLRKPFDIDHLIQVVQHVLEDTNKK